MGYLDFYPHLTYSRIHYRTVAFSPAFASAPVVTIAFVLFDVDYRWNIRVSSKISSVSSRGVLLAVWEWSDTKTFRIGISWFACL